MTEPAVIEINKGSGKRISATWPNGAGGAADLSGYQIEPFDTHPALEGHLTLTFLNAALGTWSGRIIWQDDMPEGQIMSFRIRLVPRPEYPDLDPDSTPEIFVKVI